MIVNFIAISPNREDQKRGVVKLKDDPNQMGTQITLIARIALNLSYSDLTTPLYKSCQEILGIN
jgi:hypothetical protein